MTAIKLGFRGLTKGETVGARDYTRCGTLITENLIHFSKLLLPGFCRRNSRCYIILGYCRTSLMSSCRTYSIVIISWRGEKGQVGGVGLEKLVRLLWFYLLIVFLLLVFANS